MDRGGDITCVFVHVDTYRAKQIHITRLTFVKRMEYAVLHTTHPTRTGRFLALTQMNVCYT